ncbi:hypothetical protein CROQUDRAFT_664661 [Cronartium quercuum f. sp. fusiforme G11]|uniref:Uncharacterized protein n=1 Tax=Cronartium quercuum f. sp. fusiforme G11 TaxID=708437 RepID=A0A9P6N7N4_9BASI|nr:hypothetical protein CROQUDRAFT_664661 [Cronartium quercuum f. sp. fusiforme G11]
MTAPLTPTSSDQDLGHRAVLSCTFCALGMPHSVVEHYEANRIKPSSPDRPSAHKDHSNPYLSFGLHALGLSWPSKDDDENRSMASSPAPFSDLLHDEPVPGSETRTRKRFLRSFSGRRPIPHFTLQQQTTSEISLPIPSSPSSSNSPLFRLQSISEVVIKPDETERKPDLSISRRRHRRSTTRAQRISIDEPLPTNLVQCQLIPGECLTSERAPCISRVPLNTNPGIYGSQWYSPSCFVSANSIVDDPALAVEGHSVSPDLSSKNASMLAKLWNQLKRRSRKYH